ncbi:FemAB family PEP-CTERM system-associated protein [Crocinitomicaceae bacterium]|nr:FemAB family PEP-CTERM system-associated protein [Crocinitomicaceae bacterium]
MKQTSTPGIEIFEDSLQNKVAWNGFLQYGKYANFYQLFEWKTINEQEFGHKTFYLAATDNNTITGVFPLIFIRSHIFGRVICSMPFVNLGGPSADNESTEKSLVEHACSIAREENADYLEIRGLHICSDVLPRSEHKISMTLSLADDPDELWNAFKSKHRTNIRRVYKNNVHVKSGQAELLDTFYDLICHSWRSLGTPIYRKKYFQSILESFGDKIRIFVAYHGNTPVATAFNGHFNSTVEGMWAGGLPESRKLQANYVLYWEMIKDACERGFSTYHLGRSTVETGGESFKKKWNANSRQLYWQYFLPDDGEIPQLNVSNPRYQIAINIWRRLPMSATRFLGPLIARSIP